MLTSLVRDMQHYKRPWFVAGGWALDLFAGAQSREHKDVDLAIWRDDQQELRRFLGQWSLFKAVSGQLVPWAQDEALEKPVHEVHTHLGERRLEFLLNDHQNGMWLYRRNQAVSLPRESFGRVSAKGVPYLAPEVVLLYKAKATRTVDELDFTKTLPRLDPAAACWLADAIGACYPGHHWLARMQVSGDAQSIERALPGRLRLPESASHVKR
jgi:hypothetical protein